MANPLVAIVGPTASGKTAMAIKLARKYNGEIICADSRTIYKGLDISTAKPSDEERKQAPHHLLDIAEPNQVITVAEFKKLATDTIKKIQARNKLPLLVGGSGLFVDAVVYDFSFNDKPDKKLRSRLNSMDIEKLQQIIYQKGIDMPSNKMNQRHLIRAIETEGRPAAKNTKPDNVLILGMHVSKDELNQKISARVETMIANGLVEEIKTVTDRYGWDEQALQTPAFKSFRRFLEGNISLSQAQDKFIVHDRQLAKRQLTWLKRNKDIHWVSGFEQADELVAELLSNSLLQ